MKTNKEIIKEYFDWHDKVINHWFGKAEIAKQIDDLMQKSREEETHKFEKWLMDDGALTNLQQELISVILMRYRIEQGFYGKSAGKGVEKRPIDETPSGKAEGSQQPAPRHNFEKWLEHNAVNIVKTVGNIFDEFHNLQSSKVLKESLPTKWLEKVSDEDYCKAVSDEGMSEPWVILAISYWIWKNKGRLIKNENQQRNRTINR